MKINYAFPPVPARMDRSWAFWKEMFTLDQLIEIDKLSEYYEQQKAETVGATEGVALDRTRNSYITWIPYSDKTKWLYDRIGDCFQEINRNYFGFDIHGLAEDLQYTVYYSDAEHGQGHYDWHIDTGGKDTYCRKLSMSLQLNAPQEYEGGELWLHGSSKEVMQKEQGYAVFFPSYTLHRVTPVTQGIRRSLVVWANGSEWK